MKTITWFLYGTLLYTVNLNAHSSILVTTIPKSGSHLLNRTVELITGFTRKYSLPKKTESQTSYYLREYFPTINQLKKVFPLKAHTYTMRHLYYTDEYEAFVKQNNIKVLFILRDPRDLLISRVHYLKDGKRKDFRFKNLPFNLLLSALIGTKNDSHFGMKSWIEEYATNEKSICNIAQLYNDFIPWKNSCECFCTHFEDLVGSKGGGNDEAQAGEIEKIAAYLGKKLTKKQALSLGTRLFGHAGTFRKGQIGSWKKQFTQAHKEQFKKVAGQLLIDLGYEKDMNW